MQPSLFPPSEADKLRELLADDGFMHEFEVIAEAVSRALRLRGDWGGLHTSDNIFK